jgi:hypothetical protein
MLLLIIEQHLDLEITDITAKPAKVLFTSVKNKKSLEIYGHQDLVVNKIMPISSRQWQFSYHPTQGEDYQYSWHNNRGFST